MHVHQRPVSLSPTLSILSAWLKRPRALPSRPRRPRHERARQGQARGCRHPPAQVGTPPGTGYSAQTLSGRYPASFGKATDPVSPRFLLHCAFEAAIGDIRKPYPLAGASAPIWAGMGSVPCQPRDDFITGREQNLDCRRSGKLACRSHTLRQIRHACSESIGPDVLAEDFMRSRDIPAHPSEPAANHVNATFTIGSTGHASSFPRTSQ